MLTLEDLKMAAYSIGLALTVSNDDAIIALKDKVTELILDEQEPVKIGMSVHYINEIGNQDDPTSTVNGFYDGITPVSAYRKCNNITVYTKNGTRWVNKKAFELLILDS